MQIGHLKINGVTNPVGYGFDRLFASWKVEDTQAKNQAYARIEVSTRADFNGEVYCLEGADLNSRETELAGLNLRPRTDYFWRVAVTGDNGEEAISETSFFATGKREEPWQGEWITTAREDTFHPVFRKEFALEKPVAKGFLYICGLGAFEAYLNGEKVGDDILAPFLTDYEENYQVITYDVTGQLSAGPQEIEIYLGKSWYMGRFGLQNQEKNFGDRMMAIAELHVEYEDGSSLVVATDGSWQYRGSDVEDSGIYFGEVLNRRLWEGKENPWKPAETGSPKAKLVDRYGVSVKVMETLKAKEILHTPAGETVVDFGQNHAGYMEFWADFPAGTTVKLEVGEVLQEGNFYHGNYRDAESVFVYTSNGKKELVRPHFTFYGYRYLKVSGWPGEPGLGDIKARVLYSELERTGYFKTSDEKVNRLYANALWGQKSNFIDIPTDCPQRSERLGWTGDTQVFAPTASYNMDTRAFYAKFLRDIHTEQQRADGAVPNFFPSFGEAGGTSIWGDVATFVPDTLYQFYGIGKQMEDYYPMMREWVEFMHQKDRENGDRGLFENGFSFGDWLALDGMTEQSFKGSTDDHYLDTAYYYQSTRILAKAARQLYAQTGRREYQEDAQNYGTLAEKIKNAFLDQYVTPAGRLSVDTQAGYVVALKFGLYRDQGVMIGQFRGRLRKDSYKIKCGFVGAPLLCLTLCENGMEDLAYYFLFNEEFPGWLYCVDLGATTIWERWNSLLPDGTISGTGMNSLNHYAYGSVVEFMYKYIAGIRPLEPGFGRALIAPVPSMRFRNVSCSYDSASGNYVSDWKIEEDGTFRMHVEVPFNCQAKVVFPRYQGQDVPFAGGREGDGAVMEGGAAVLGAGSYEFAYMPEEDFRKVYGPGTRLREMAEDEEAMEILKETLPAAYGIIVNKDAENMDLCFGELKHMFYMGISPKDVEAAEEKIYHLIRY